MVLTRSQHAAARKTREEAAKTDLWYILSHELDNASCKKYKEVFDRIRKFYNDDVSNILGFWFDERIIRTYFPRYNIRDYNILVRLVDYAGLEHPLMRAQLHRQTDEALNLIGVVRYTKQSAEGDTAVHYRHKAGELTTAN
jgi:hypothetical protein